VTTLQQHTERLGVNNRVFGPLGSVTGWAKKLDVADLMWATSFEGHDVVNMPVFWGDWAFTNRAAVLLFFRQLFDLCSRNFSFCHSLFCAPIFFIRSVFIRVGSSPCAHKLASLLGVSNSPSLIFGFNIFKVFFSPTCGRSFSLLSMCCIKFCFSFSSFFQICVSPPTTIGSNLYFICFIPRFCNINLLLSVSRIERRAYCFHLFWMSLTPTRRCLSAAFFLCFQKACVLFSKNFLDSEKLLFHCVGNFT
jgi:hypothetical protein